MRGPFNIIVNILFILSIPLSGLVYWYFATLDGPFRPEYWYVHTVFVAFFLIIYFTIVVSLRLHILDRGMMYKADDYIEMQDNEFFSFYRKVNSGSSYITQHTELKNIKRLTMLVDEKTGLEVLQVDASEIYLRRSYYSDGGSNDGGWYGFAYDGKEKTLYEPDSRRYYPLYYQDSDVFVDYLLASTGLKLNREMVNIRELKEKRL